MLGRVGAPGSPALGPREQFAGCRPFPFRIGQGAQQTDVAGWKRIRLAQFTHRDVLRSPLANAGQCTKLRHTFSDASSGAKDLWILGNDGRASDASVAARIRGIPSAVRGADARRSGRGKT